MSLCEERLELLMKWEAECAALATLTRHLHYATQENDSAQIGVVLGNMADVRLKVETAKAAYALHREEHQC